MFRRSNFIAQFPMTLFATWHCFLKASHEHHASSDGCSVTRIDLLPVIGLDTSRSFNHTGDEIFAVVERGQTMFVEQWLCLCAQSTQ